jgi:cell division protein ZapD
MNNETKIIYEQPLSELLRVVLRLEHVFQQLGSIQSEIHSSQHIRLIIKLIVDLLNLLDRPDLKFKLSQEFNRLINNFNRLQNVSNIHHKMLNDTLQKLKKLMNGYLGTRGKIAESLRTNEFIINIRQGLLSAGGDSCIDIPHYFYWLNQPLSFQQEQIRSWLHVFDDIRYSTELLLDIVRNSSEPHELIAEKGFYHQMLDSQHTLQLLRVGLSNNVSLYPEISAGRLRASFRFLIPSIERRPRQTLEDVKFELTCCSI